MNIPVFSPYHMKIMEAIDYAAELADEMKDPLGRMPPRIQLALIEAGQHALEQGSRWRKLSRLYRELSDARRRDRDTPRKFIVDDARLYVSARFKILSMLRFDIVKELLSLYVPDMTIGRESETKETTIVFVHVTIDAERTWLPLHLASVTLNNDETMLLKLENMRAMINIGGVARVGILEKMSMSITLGDRSALEAASRVRTHALLYGRNKILAMSDRLGDFGGGFVGASWWSARHDLVAFVPCSKRRIGGSSEASLFVPETRAEVSHGLLLISAPRYSEALHSGLISLPPWEFRTKARALLVENASDNIWLYQPYSAIFLDGNMSDEDLHRLAFLRNPEIVTARAKLL